MNEQNTIFCKTAKDKLELYVRQSDGSVVYLMTHRFNSTLYKYLKDGKTVRELRSFRPKRNRGQKAISHSLSQAVEVFDYLTTCEAA